MSHAAHRNGKTDLLATGLGGPNGIAFSPDETFFYVSNWDIRDVHNTKTLWRYEVKPDGTLTNGMVFFDVNQTDNKTLYLTAHTGLHKITTPNGGPVAK